ncbi:hypothetical protein VP01_1445g2 [Puccinia sorghi]|uniref:Uncharacterized protein n=1 Tax=Puccinia sorghi TaxID=27349 RepID=A0A0L6VKQ3_9BASI|nr:hypothetical protein VP01_1445g2 [Puccinia sorghi]
MFLSRQHTIIASPFGVVNVPWHGVYVPAQAAKEMPNPQPSFVAKSPVDHFKEGLAKGTIVAAAVVFHLRYNAKSTLHRRKLSCSSTHRENSYYYKRKWMGYIITRGGIQWTRYSGGKYVWSKDGMVLLCVTVLEECKEGTVEVRGGRKEVWEESPRPPNPSWKIVWLHSLYCIVHGILYCIMNVWWKCVESTEIYAEACRVAQPLLNCAWNVWVATFGQHSNICKWLQDCGLPLLSTMIVAQNSPTGNSKTTVEATLFVKGSLMPIPPKRTAERFNTIIEESLRTILLDSARRVLTKFSRASLLLLISFILLEIPWPFTPLRTILFFFYYFFEFYGRARRSFIPGQLSHVELQAQLRTKCCFNSLRFLNQTSTHHISTCNTQPMRAQHSQIKCKQAF